MSKLKLSELAKALEEGRRVEYFYIKSPSVGYKITAERELALRFSMEECDVRTAPKLIKPDLSCLVGSDVICEFWNYASPENKYMGKLLEIREPSFMKDKFQEWSHCQPALNLWQVHHGGECPLPKEARVVVRWGNVELGDSREHGVGAFCWRHNEPCIKLTAYKFTGWANE